MSGIASYSTVAVNNGTGAPPIVMLDTPPTPMATAMGVRQIMADIATLTVGFVNSAVSITTNTTINGPVYALPGCLYTIANGVTLTFSGAFSAGVYPVFNCVGTGAVAFTNPVGEAYPEWWGCVTNNSAAAATNLTAINAALIAHPNVRIQPADYWVSGTIINALTGHTLTGHSDQYDGVTAGQATRILCTSATADILQLGPTTQPASRAAFPLGVGAASLYLARVTAPSIASNCSGVVVRFANTAKIDRVKSVDSMNGFRVFGTIDPYLTQCAATRVVAGSGAGDFWNGYLIDGTASIGLAGGNGSVYLSQTQASCNIASLQTAGSVGYNLISGYQDTFLNNTESSQCNYGAWLQGGSANADVSISHPVFDQCYTYGIYVQSQTAGQAVNITDPYAGTTTGSSNTSAGIYLNACAGPVTITAGQVYAFGLSFGILVGNASSNVSIDKTVIVPTNSNNALAIGAETSGTFAPIIVNNTGADSPYAAVLINGAAVACVLRPQISGANKFIDGIQVTVTTDDRCTYDLGGINSAAITGGYANKLIRNGASPLTSPTMLPFYAGTNLVTGCVG